MRFLVQKFTEVAYRIFILQYSNNLAEKNYFLLGPLIQAEFSGRKQAAKIDFKILNEIFTVSSRNNDTNFLHTHFLITNWYLILKNILKLWTSLFELFLGLYYETQLGRFFFDTNDLQICHISSTLLV